MTDPTHDLLRHDTLLLVPGVTLTPDGPLDRHAVLVRDGVFDDVGPVERLLRTHPSLTPVRLPEHVLMPGFVDTHHHLTQSFGGALAFGEPSEIFRRVWVPLERALDEESAYVAAKLAALESLRGGFTTVAESGTRAAVDVDVVASATRDAGIRCLLGLVCNDASDGTGEDADPRAVLAAAERHLARYGGGDLVHPSLAVSVPEAATASTLAATARLAAEAGAVVQIHVNEHLVAVERSLVRHGLRPLEHLRQVGALGPQLLAAHATLLTPSEVTLLADSGAAVSYNPVASAWKGNAVAPATAFAERGVRFGLGTDGTRGDGFRLADAAEFAQRLTYGLASGDSSCGAGWTWLERATAGGAEAAGLGGLTGRVAPGAAADFLLVDVGGPEMQPSWDLPWELVRRGNRDQLTAVFVAGRLRLWRGWPSDWDGPALVRRAAALGRRVVRRAQVVRAHPTSVAARNRGATVPSPCPGSSPDAAGSAVAATAAPVTAPARPEGCPR
ncbi:Cytosine/adenosine deaminase [Streptomyces sp. 1222.5]|uniref:amidohydrolase family protein n=1 Tax=unclassified Streptomyces TaxID=2593676 RepID=UPI000899749D|nr:MULTISPECIES: amidohydrolase family protein [unclassified Streptomyces]PKW11879.1 cytosine/adenosine deaminase-related metal-dependent hydrolase [Streptomyces sp. 5112.2]SEB67822.1 Cytosine/adenosine deaminase [Streptomyces sp. 1222.5]